MKYWFLIAAVFISISSHSQSHRVSQYFLGFQLIDTGTGDLVRFGLVKISPNGDKKISYMTKSNFFLQASGEQESLGNENKIDYWAKYEVYWKTVDMLWKLKYSEYPYQKREDTEGWANLRQSASPGQLRYLQKYGFEKHISDFIYGEKCFELLRDIQNPEWQYNYSMM